MRLIVHQFRLVSFTLQALLHPYLLSTLVSRVRATNGDTVSALHIREVRHTAAIKRYAIFPQGNRNRRGCRRAALRK